MSPAIESEAEAIRSQVRVLAADCESLAKHLLRLVENIRAQKTTSCAENKWAMELEGRAVGLGEAAGLMRKRVLGEPRRSGS